MTIAVIDQEADYLEILNNYLQNLEEDYSIQRDLSRSAILSELPDMIIADFNTQNISLFEELTLKITNKHIPFIFITQEEKFSHKIIELQATGLVDFISKPVNEINLISRFTHLIKYAQQLTYFAQTKSELESQKNQLRDLSNEQGYLMSIVAHDLKSPLNKVLGLSQLLPLIGDLNDEQKKCIDLLNKVVEGGRKLINDILIINAYETHGEPLQFVDIDLKTFVEESVNSFLKQGEQKSINLRFKASEDISIHSDKQSLTRILDNLIDNAIKFSPKNTEIYITIKKSASHAIITVKDQGPGFSEEDQQKMFKKFQKLSARPTDGESSTGLGLSIIKVLVEILRGYIEVDTKRGKGTAFTIALPLKDTPKLSA